MKKILCSLALLISTSAYTQLYVPNSFTPNGDGVNDVFQPVTDDTLSHYELQIYNAYGELVFRTTDITTPWSGGSEYYNNVNVYPYKIIFKQQEERFYQVIFGCVKMIR